MRQMNWKKAILFTVIAPFAPVLGQWANSVSTGNEVAFTAGNILVPAIPALVTTLAALFSNPWKK